MKKVITALGNPKLLQELKNKKMVKIMTNDIQYKEGILEFLEKEKNIDLILLNENISGIINLEELIYKIKEKKENIKIIVLFLQLKNISEKIKNMLEQEKIKYYFYEKEITVSDINNILLEEEEKRKEKNSNEEIKEEIKNLREIILEKNKKESFLQKIREKKIVQKWEKSWRKEGNITTKIISVLGAGGIGKSVTCVNLAHAFSQQKKKVLLLDFDLLNNSLHTILGVNKYPLKLKNKIKKGQAKNTSFLEFSEIKVQELIVKTNKKIDLISGIDIILNNEKNKIEDKIEKIIKEVKEKYDVIIVDTSCECFWNATKIIMENSNICVLISQANLSEISKTKNLISIYTEKWNIEKSKIVMAFNKTNENDIQQTIIRNIFSEYPILGKIKWSKKYNYFINNNMNKIMKDRKIQRQYCNLTKQLKKQLAKIVQ